MTIRRFAPPHPVAVTADPADGAPLALRRRGHTDAVTAVEATWELDTGWWASGDRSARRRYFRLRTRGGLLCTVYRDLTTGRWFLDSIFD